MEKITPQALFLSYAFPVIKYCAGQKPSSEEIENLENILEKGSKIQTSVLEKYFPDAAKYIPVWTTRNVQDYWLRKHNELKNGNILCQTYVARIGDDPQRYQNKNGIFNGKKLITPSYINVDKGDVVAVHNFTVAQKLNEKMIAEYFPKFK